MMLKISKSPAQQVIPFLVMLLGNIIPVPFGNFYDDFTRLLDRDLAAETRVELQIGSHVEAVSLVVIHLAQQLGAFDDVHVARGAGAVAAAGVVEKDVVVNRNV